MTEAVTLAAVKREVAAHFGLAPERLTIPLERGGVSDARHIGMFLARRLTGRTNGQIARQFGVGNSSTVTHAVAKIEGQRAADPEMGRTIATLAKRLGREIAA